MSNEPKRNPHLMRPGRAKGFDPRVGKFYRSVIIYAGNQQAYAHQGHRTATQAITYAQRLIDRWCRLYNAWLIEATATKEA